MSADERYELFLDGVRVGRGPERGDILNWFYDTYEVALAAGKHVLLARVWVLGELAPHAQISCMPGGAGFILAPDDRADAARFATGSAPWEAMRMEGVGFTSPLAAWGTGARLRVDGSRFPWGWEAGHAEAVAAAAWQPVRIRAPGNHRIAANVPANEPLLRPAQLPAQLERAFYGGRVRHVSAPDADCVARNELHTAPLLARDDLPDEHAAWQAVFAREHPKPVRMPPHTRRRVIVDLDTYLCSYPEIITSGGRGARVRLHWVESLCTTAEAFSKGWRGEVEGKYFTIDWADRSGVGDMFLPDGGQHRRFDTLWWECGRFVELLVVTGDDALVIEAINLRETRYPLENESVFDASDPRLAAFIPVAHRTLQMCAHETFMDCPFYEQLMYAGDTRIEALVTYATTRDARLARRAIELFDASRLPGGLTQSRYPSRVRQIIPPFSLWWIGMVHDYLLWRGSGGEDEAFIRARMAGVRAVVDSWLRVCEESHCNGLAGPQSGWAFVDWAADWHAGVPPGATEAGSAPVNLQWLLALRQAAELEMWAGEPELASRARRIADKLERTIDAVFWVEERGMWADDPAHRHFSEHSQCLALLCGGFSGEHRGRALAGLLATPEAAPNLARCSIYFSHYKLEALAHSGRGGAELLAAMEEWWRRAESGFVTTPEESEPSRSDCHAWGAHPLFHFYASVLGIRPGSPGFRTVRVMPQPGDLRRVEGAMVHPAGGEIRVCVEQDIGGETRIAVRLPASVSGELVWEGRRHVLIGSGDTQAFILQAARPASRTDAMVDHGAIL